MDYFLRMKHLEAFIEAEGLLEERPDRVVSLAARALLEISFLRGDEPARLKKGLPVFEHSVPDERRITRMTVRPFASHFLWLDTPELRARAAGLPASLSCSNALQSGFFSFEKGSDLVAVDLSRNGYGTSGYSSETEQGRNVLRNTWRELHAPTIAYVQQAATHLA